MKIEEMRKVAETQARMSMDFRASPSLILKLIAVVEAAKALRDSLLVGRDDVEVVPFDRALKELETT